MNYSLFTHKSCGGTLLPDCGNMFTIKSPSLSISLTGVKIGVLEIQSKNNSGVLLLNCSKCDASIKSTELDEIVCECVICHKKGDIKEMNVSKEYPLFCDSCKAILAGEAESPEDMRRVFSYLSAPTKSAIKPLTTVLKIKPTV
jgi:hypothetical protein